MLLYLHVSPLMCFIWLNGACWGDKMVQGCREHSCVWLYSATEHQLSNSKTANIINYFLFMHYQKWLCNMNWSMLHIPNILPLSIRHAALVVTAILRRSCFSTYLPGGFSSHLALALEYSLCFLLGCRWCTGSAYEGNNQTKLDANIGGRAKYQKYR